MEKTIGNIKKFLHIGSKSERKEKLEIIHQLPEKAILNHQTISTSVEINGEDVKRRYTVILYTAVHSFGYQSFPPSESLMQFAKNLFNLLSV